MEPRLDELPPNKTSQITAPPNMQQQPDDHLIIGLYEYFSLYVQ